MFALFLPLQVATAGNVLIVGDSIAEFAGKAIEDFCRGATTNNAGIAGTTTTHWQGSDVLSPIGTQQCGGTPDYIWLSIGGNDVLGDAWGCDNADDVLAAKLIASIEAVKAKAPSAKLVMTGYCMPADVPPVGPDSSCNTPEKLNSMMAVLKHAAERIGATFVNSVTACGGSSTSWSNKKYFQDPIHLNNRGYCKLFTQSEVQAAFGCQAANYDCDSVAPIIRGRDQLCATAPTGLLGLSQLDSIGSRITRKQQRDPPRGFLSASLMELKQGAFGSHAITQMRANTTDHTEF